MLGGGESAASNLQSFEFKGKNMSTDKDSLGDRIKEYEGAETQGKFMKGLPIVIRLDGRSFSKYTKKFNRPFDEDMSYSMVETTKFLVNETNAVMGYTQSDEITLILFTDDPKSELFFAGKKFKIISNLASLAAVKFYSTMVARKGSNAPEKLPSFDCRAFQVPSKMEAWNALLWRVQDATRNSIQMLGQAHFSHKQLQGLNQNKIIEMLFEEKGIKWVDLPHKYKEGSFVRVEKVLKPIASIVPEGVVLKGMYQPNGVVERSVITEISLEKRFNAISNREAFIFDKAVPTFIE